MQNENKTPILEYLAQPGNTQTKLADDLQMSQTGVDAMKNRQVFIVENKDGSVEAHEFMKLPLRRRSKG